GGGVSRGGAGIRGETWTSVASCDVALLVSGMMIAPALAAARLLRAAGAVTAVVSIPIIKPLDTATVLSVAASAGAVVTAENHSVIGGLGSAVAEPWPRPAWAAPCAASAWPTRSPKAPAMPRTCSPSTGYRPSTSWTRPGRCSIARDLPRARPPCQPRLANTHPCDRYKQPTCFTLPLPRCIPSLPQ